MPDQPKAVLVTGATGRQGRSVIKYLLQDEYRHRFRTYGLTRDADQQVSRDLASAGVQMIEGDLQDPSSVDRVFEMVDVVFGLANYWLTDSEGFIEMSETIARLSEAHDIEHLIYSSLANCDQDTGVPHFDTTHEGELRVQKYDVPLTIVRPVMFMQNFEFQTANVFDGQLRFPVEEDTTLKLIDVDDIGLTAVQALAHPEEFVGKTLEIAGDAQTLSSAAAVFSKVTGRAVEPDHVDVEDRAEIVSMYNEGMADDLTEMFEWFIDGGYDVDPGVSQQEVGTAFTDLEYYLRKNGWDDEEAKLSQTDAS